MSKTNPSRTMKNNNVEAVSGPDFIEVSHSVFFFYRSTEASCAALIKWASTPSVFHHGSLGGSAPPRELHVFGGGGLVYSALIAMNFVCEDPSIHTIFVEPCSTGTMMFGLLHNKGQRRYTVMGSLSVHGFDTYCHRHPDVVYQMLRDDLQNLIRFGVSGSFLYTWADALTRILGLYRDYGCINVANSLDTYLELSVEDATKLESQNINYDDILVMMDNSYSRRYTLK